VSGRVRIPVEQRFWEKVSRRGYDECWPWLAGTYPRGYGKFSIAKGDLEQKKAGYMGAHRVAFRLVHGRWPENALHGCDNKACCNALNPAHVHEGTQQQNLQEMTERGRRAYGPRLATNKVGADSTWARHMRGKTENGDANHHP